MTVNPNSLPIWNANPTIESYGGNVNKRNYNTIAEIDPETDVTAEEYSSLVDHLQAIAKTNPFAVIDITLTASTPAVTSYRGQNGIGLTNAPSVSYSSNAIVVTFAQNYADSYGQSSAISIGGATATPNNASGSVYLIGYDIVNAYTIRFWLRDTSGTPVTTGRFTAAIYRTV